MSDDKKRLVVLISGRGSNLAALLAAMGNSHYQIVSVISDQQAAGLQHAKAHQISTESLLRQDFPSRDLQREAIFAAVRAARPDYVILAGFMLIIPKRFTDEFAGRLLNIHPSLLPKFPGLDSHQRALAAGETVHGCSVHFVDEGMDSGPLVAQAQCPVLSDDTSESLSTRVFQLEHRLYPWVVEQICAGQIKLIDRQVSFSSSALKQAQELGFLPMIENNTR
jgi:phosphoribosylglycinamide formyltransferase 1